ncbi:von Willebrand factor D and EGF domain-containing protein-like [Glandiceps talaboti]
MMKTFELKAMSCGHGIDNPSDFKLMGNVQNLPPDGDNVCPVTSTRIVTYAGTIRVTYAQRYTTNCGVFGWSGCTKYRTAYRTEYVTQYKSETYTEYICCDGYYQEGDLCLDPCKNYTTLDQPWRSMYIKQDPAEAPRCDSPWTTQWYRFDSDAGGEMPNVCVQPSYCGSDFPVWMAGQPPLLDGHIHQRTACATTSDDSCCEDSWDIQTKNCSTYNVYYLPEVARCNMTYCEGNDLVCEEDTNGECVEMYPLMDGPPTLRGPIINGDGTFHFSCTVNFKKIDEFAFFEIEWLFDHKPHINITSTILPWTVDVSVILTGDRLSYEEGRLGVSVGCRVRSFYEDVYKSHWYFSNDYFAGIKVDKTEIPLLLESSTQEEVKLWSTIPILCEDETFQPTPGHCKLLLVLATTVSYKESPYDELSITNCGLELLPSDWNKTTNTAETEFSVYARRDFVDDGTSTSYLLLGSPSTSSVINSDYLKIWEGYKVDPISVTAISFPHKLCKATGDPHYTSFDRVEDGKNLFTNYADLEKVAEDYSQTCTCPDSSSDNVLICCGSTTNIEQTRVGTDVTRMFAPNSPNNGGESCVDKDTTQHETLSKYRSKRDSERRILDDYEDDEDFDHDYDPDFEPYIPDWPTPSGLTENTTRELCESLLQGASFTSACLNLTDIDLDPYIEECMVDIQVTDDKNYAMSALGGVESLCVDIATRNLSLYEEDDDGNLVPPSDIVSVVCPNECSFRGECVDNECICQAGYISSDCSIVEGEPPSVSHLKHDGLCDVRMKPCETCFVIGDKFLDSENLTCQVRQAKDNPSSTGVTVDAELLSFTEVACLLPKHNINVNSNDIDSQPKLPIAYSHISVSNDGVKFSDDLLFTIYDSVCVNCSVGGSCHKKPNSCFINGTCFAEDDEHPTKPSLVCIPSNHEFEWTDTSQTDFKVWLIIGVILGISAAVGLIVIVVILISIQKEKMKKNRAVSPMTEVVQLDEHTANRESDL